MTALLRGGSVTRWAARVHRISGLALAVFLPVHFLILGLALETDDSFDSFFVWSQHHWVKVSEWALLMCLVVHLMLGVRVVLIVLAEWRGERQVWIGAAALFGGVVSAVFWWLNA